MDQIMISPSVAYRTL